MLLARDKARRQLGQHPILLDPVGAGASALRTNTARRTHEGAAALTVIRGNISEIKTLALGSGTTKGRGRRCGRRRVGGKSGQRRGLCEGLRRQEPAPSWPSPAPSTW